MRLAIAARRESKNRKDIKMIRNLKALGLALVAVFAMSAVVASAASAAIPSLTAASGPVTLSGSDTAGTKSTLTAFGLKTECTGSYTAHKYNVTPREFIPSGATTITVTPVYTNCVGVIGGTSTPATVTMNGCDYVLHVGNTVAGVEKYGGTTDVVCPESQQIEVHVYTNSTHATTICTVKVPGQTGLVGGTVQNNAGNLKLGGPITGIRSTKTGILCGGTAETTIGEEDISAEVSGAKEGGGANSVSISD
jgi:hypothetical protein